METHEVDVVVIGLGPGGEDAAGALAEAGLRVVGIEGHLVGGECPYYACIPSKAMVYLILGLLPWMVELLPRPAS